MAAAAAAAAARRCILSAVSTRPCFTPQAFAQQYRFMHGRPSNGFGKKLATGEDLSKIKHEIIEELVAGQNKVQLALKDVEKEVSLMNLKVDNQESRIILSQDLIEVTAEGSNAKNSLYMVALGFTMCSGVFSIVRLYNLCAEMFPYGLFPLRDEPTENQE